MLDSSNPARTVKGGRERVPFSILDELARRDSLLGPDVRALGEKTEMPMTSAGKVQPH